MIGTRPTSTRRFVLMRDAAIRRSARGHHHLRFVRKVRRDLGITH